MGLAWAPLLWLSTQRSSLREVLLHGIAGLLLIAGLTAAALLVHALPLGLHDVPHHALGLVTLLGMAALYLCLVVLQLRPQALRTWRRWSYAAFMWTRPTHAWPCNSGPANGHRSPPASTPKPNIRSTP